jgi:hypothetical protein
LFGPIPVAQCRDVARQLIELRVGTTAADVELR